MVTMMLVASFGATEAAIADSYRATGQDILIFSTRKRAFLGERPIQLPTWLNLGPKGQTIFQVSRYLERLISDLGVTHVLSVGLSASFFAARHLADVGYTSVLLRGELDFGRARHGKGGVINQISSTASELVLENHWEMDKACCFGSCVPHLRLPLLCSPGGGVFSDLGTRVAILHDETSDQQGALLRGLSAACVRSGVDHRSVAMRSLFKARDLRRGTTLESALRRRLGGFTHAVILGDHRDTAAAVATLAQQPDRLIVEGTIASTELVSRLEAVRCGRGTALIARLEEMLATWGDERRGFTHKGRRVLQRAAERPRTAGRIARKANRALDRMDAKRSQARSLQSPKDTAIATWFSNLRELDRPWYYEELWAESSPGTFDVYFTVAPVENRANGARPQRIRNVGEAMHDRSPTVVLRPIGDLLDRRSVLIQGLLADGWAPRMVYGENSTSPMESVDMIDRVAACFRWLGERGALRAWFVRDLHWLSEEKVAGYEPSREIVERGIIELQSMQAVTELLLAPSESSLEEFEELLAAYPSVDAHWDPMPPALSPDNVCNIEKLAKDAEGLTLLYAGGMNGFYRQDVFLSAVAELSGQPGFHLDLVVRESDADFLRESLERANLAPKDTIRILTDDLSKYLPLTRNVLGVVLLDGRYATRAFPYKTISMLERGLHVLCYEDMAIAPFLRKYDAGVFCGRDVGSVVKASRDYRDRHGRIDVAPLIQSESWSARLDELWDKLVRAHRRRLVDAEAAQV